MVSPGFTSRPSLSVDARRPPSSLRVSPVPAFVERAGCPDAERGRHVSPGFTSRPSLSVSGDQDRRCVSSVAGIHVPAFVERSDPSAVHVQCRERPALSVESALMRRVSPGFTSRPSLSVRRSSARRVACRGIHVGVEPLAVCRSMTTVSPGFTSRPSLSDGARVGADRPAADSAPLLTVAGLGRYPV